MVRGRALGRTLALGMAGVPVGVGAGSVPGAWLVSVWICSLSRVICLSIWVIWLCCHGRVDGVFSYVYTGQYSGSGFHSCSTPCCELGICLGWE